MFELILAVLAGLLVLDVALSAARRRANASHDAERHAALMRELRRHA